MTQSVTATTAPVDRSADRAGQRNPGQELVLVLDFGGQTAQLIARRVREQNVFCQLVRHDLSVERIRELGVAI